MKFYYSLTYPSFELNPLVKVPAQPGSQVSGILCCGIYGDKSGCFKQYFEDLLAKSSFCLNKPKFKEEAQEIEVFQ